MKNGLISILYLLALAFSANVLADEEDYNEPQKQEDEQKVEGEVEEAKNGLQLREGMSDKLFLDTVAKVVGGLLSKGGVPQSQADMIAKHAADAVKQEQAAAGNSLSLREGNVDGLFLDTITKVVGGLLSKGGVPQTEAQATAQHIAEQAHSAVKQEAAGNSLYLREGNVHGLFLDTVAKVVGGLLSKGGVPQSEADMIAKHAADAVKQEQAAAGNSLSLREGNVDGLFLDTITKVVGGLLSKGGVPQTEAQATAQHIAEQAHSAVKQEAAGNFLSLREGNVHGLFLDTVAKVVGSLLSKGGVPQSEADMIAKHAADAVKQEQAAAGNSLSLREGNVDGLFLDTITKVVGGLLSKGGVPQTEAQATAQHIAEQAHSAVKQEAASNSLYLREANVHGFDWKGAIGKGISVGLSLLSKGHAPEAAQTQVAKAMQEHAEGAAAASNSLKLDETIDAIDWGKIAKTGLSIAGALLSAGVPPEQAQERAATATAEIHKDDQ